MSWLPDWLTGYDSANAKKAAEADATLRAIHQSEIASGKYSPAQIEAINADYQAQGSFDPLAQRDDIQATFNTAVGDQVKKLGDAANAGFFGFLKAIPISIWIIGGIALFFWAGGPALLKGRIAKRFA